jgi:hypothetical protein
MSMAATEKIGAAIPGFAVGRHQRRFVFLHGVEQMAAAGFDHAGHASGGEGITPADDAAGQISREGIKRVVVERNGQRPVAHLAEHGDRVERIDVADAVGAEAEQHDEWADDGWTGGSGETGFRWG